MFELYLKFDNDNILAVYMYYSDSWRTTPYIYNKSDNTYTYYEDIAKGSRYYINTDETDNGIVTFLPENSKLLNIMANTSSVQLHSKLILNGKEFSQQTGWVTVKTNFAGLEKKTEITKPSDDAVYIKAIDYNSSEPEMYVLKKEGYTGFALVYDKVLRTNSILC